VYSVGTRCLAALLLVGIAHAQDIPKDYGQPAVPRVVAYVRVSLRNGDLASAEAMAKQYRRLNGDTPEALEALSWVARGQLAAGRVDEAIQQSEDIERSSHAALGTRTLDSEPHLPLALGAAYEVQAEALYSQHKLSEAIQLLQSALRKFHGTSLVERLQKNINLMTLEGKRMPPLSTTEWIGVKGNPAAWQGKVLLLLFWAHWCADCKIQVPVIAKLAAEFGSKGLVVVAPTERYGYTMDDDHAPPAKETAFIQKVFERYYSSIPNVRVPLDAANFERFGASTTPTIALVDRRGIVKLYHPGLMDEASLVAALQPLLR
jgi:thiol-disulfide isomerase/thioredoxin